MFAFILIGIGLVLQSDVCQGSNCELVQQFMNECRHVNQLEGEREHEAQSRGADRSHPGWSAQVVMYPAEKSGKLW